eukprot:Transcript_4143.p1 GENE.Transcript_4143~~Transcript_4143.p1  ORF type:complete len:293 (+),score=119.18 Transcript_4143:1011-1889(+)
MRRRTLLSCFLFGLAAASADQPPRAGGGSSEELEHLLLATSLAIAEQPAGREVKDKLRLLHAKLLSLRQVAAETEQHEWDAMLHALLTSREYGSEQIASLLRTAGGAEAPSCDADGGAPAAHAPVGRRLREAPAGHHQQREAEAAAAGGGAAPQLSEAWGAATHGLTREALAAQWDAWKRWALDRPPPWERDCDCCYPTCPEPLICLRQSDNLYLACRGKSVGQVLDELWTQRPETVVGVCVAVVGLWLTWVALQVNKVWWWWREDGPEAKEEEEDEEDDDEEEEGEEEKTN